MKGVLSSAVEKSAAAAAADAAGVTVVELDDLADGDRVQDALQSITGIRTVPQVFIGGKIIGGCDDTLAQEASGALAGMIDEAFLSKA